MVRLLLLSVFSLVILAGCSAPESGDSGGTTANIITLPGPAEVSYCTTSHVHLTPVTITGTAQYKRRDIVGDINDVTPRGLGAIGAARPIRFAEIRVTNAAGTEVQCGQTDATGALKALDAVSALTVPQANVTYTITVYSRANNSSKLIASVLNSPDKNEPYELEVTGNGSANFSVGSFTAEATGDILGGAFNILDLLFEANEYLRTKAGTCGTNYTGCTNFTVASKVSAYWKKGFNPNSYLGRSGGISFYLPSYDRLFILGGINGDTDNTDTDHFDSSVILHEYGHFLEDNEFISDSPGGAHSGTAMIDPRLAWSEGFGNFFQAAVLGSPYYIDTTGNIDGASDFAFYIDLELASNIADQDHDHLDDPTEAGEGTFREFSVTRFLYDIVDTPADGPTHGGTDNVIDRFEELWAVLKINKKGFNNPNAAFRNAGNFTLWQPSLTGATNLSDLRLIEYQVSGNTEYGSYLTPGSCSAFTIIPVAANGPSLTSSNYLRNNDFYHIKIATAGSYTFQMNFSGNTGAGATSLSDLDFYLYNESGRIGVSADIKKYSWEENVDTNGVGGITVADAQTESFTVTLSPGNYLLQVNVYKSAAAPGGATDYTLHQNGSALCPTVLPEP